MELVLFIFEMRVPQSKIDAIAHLSEYLSNKTI
jgi:hypothetical protein